MRKAVFNKSRIYGLILPVLLSTGSLAQSAWPSESWNTAVNLTPVMNANGVTELSGLYWNDLSKRLLVSHGDGGLRVLQLNSSTNTFSQLAVLSFSGGTEGITQVNPAANEFYAIDEDSYQIRKYTHQPNFSPATVSLSRSWNITASPSTMPNTGNTGPEGIAFVPDSFLAASGFISQHTGQPYPASVKGMGGLLFIAHQNQGYVWVFDVNPNVSNDFAFVGKYRTNSTESCDIAFDRSTGLLYILHNAGPNTLEATDLSTVAQSGGERKFVVKSFITLASTPDTNKNVEGFAIVPKCNDTSNVSVWLCRDIESVESSSMKKDCLRWFQPFSAPGDCFTPQLTLNLEVFIQGFYSGNGIMRAAIDPVLQPSLCDTMTIELRNNDPMRTLAYSRKSVLGVNGSLSASFPAQVSGNAYYIVLKHRNALETWSSVPVNFSGGLISYSFTGSGGSAYGSNLFQLGDGNYAIYSGDTDQDGFIDFSDLDDISSWAEYFLSGYRRWDLTGDLTVESEDYVLTENNVGLNLQVQRP